VIAFSTPANGTTARPISRAWPDAHSWYYKESHTKIVLNGMIVGACISWRVCYLFIFINLFANKSTIITSNKVSGTEQDSKAH